MLRLKINDQEVSIEQGELVSYRSDGHEYIHQKGDPGWSHADTEMFPIIGPTADAGYRVHVPRGNAILDQHGHLRELEYELLEHSETEARFRKTYVKGTVVANSKYPKKSTAQRLIWPFDFEFEKHFSLAEDGLTIEFIIKGEKDMPFMLGYHPAFKLYSDQPTIVAQDGVITLQEVLDVGSRAFEVPNCNEIVLKDERELKIETQGFENFMLWTEVPNMLCIEPITFYPFAVGQEELYEGFIHLNSEEMCYIIKLIP
ncbi:MAG: aldose 1-epimerase [Flavobacteriaceae bacterium]